MRAWVFMSGWLVVLATRRRPSLPAPQKLKRKVVLFLGKDQPAYRRGPMWMMSLVEIAIFIALVTVCVALLA
jgi:hypothetical protein